MDRTNQVCDIVEELHEELSPESRGLSPLGKGAVIRAAAEKAVEMAEEERVRMMAYIAYHCPNDARVKLVLAQCEIGAHMRSRSQSIEAVVEKKRRK